MPIPSRIVRLLLPGALVALAASCRVVDHSGPCTFDILGPCSLPQTLPDSADIVVGWPASQVTNFVGMMNVGDTLHLYFVRKGTFNPCEGVADTITTGGTWTVTKPYGGAPDSSVAAVTPLADGGALLRAKSAGKFGIWYQRDAPDWQALGVWQDVTICPGNFSIFDFQVN